MRRVVLAALAVLSMTACEKASAPPPTSAAPQELAPVASQPAPERGRILDRSGRTLAASSGSYRKVSAPRSVAAWVGTVKSPDGAAIGETGIEKWYDVELRSGGDVTLTLDAALHERLETAFGAAGRAAAVVIELDGGLRALFSKGQLEDERPLGERHIASGGAFAPASSFKPLTALAALAQGIITPSTVYECRGAFELAGASYRCFGKHGELDVTRALIVSDNAFFYQVAAQMPHERLVAAQRAFGFGTPPSVPPGAAPGRVPDEAFYEGQPRGMHPGRTLVQAIGHGALRVTPLQLARGYAAIATGHLLEPSFVARPGSGQRASLPAPYGSALELVRAALAKGVQAADGTAHFDDIAADAAGKTGTADEEVDGAATQWGWFAGWSPAKSPRVAFAFFAEGLGGRAVARIALEPGLFAL